jgi:hypothetical protein
MTGFARARLLGLGLMASTVIGGAASAADTISSFTPGDLVVSVYGDGSGNYTDNQATPITLQEITTTGTIVGQMVLPQSNFVQNGTTNYAISGEYGSSSEGTLELSGNGQYLTIAGYGVNAATYNANAASYGGGTKSCIGDANPCNPLAQTASVAGAGVTVVPRVVALIGGNGSVDTSTALTGVFNENNPRSVATIDGSTFYISGQGLNKSDTTTQGVFVAQRGATTATAVNTSIDTRTVEIYNKQLYVSTDSTEGSGVTENISTFGNLPSGAANSALLTGIKSKFAVPSLADLNSIDGALATNPAYTTASKTKGDIYLSPENYFFANATTLYIADSGNPKGDNNGSSGSGTQGLSDGGLQKWTYNPATQTWVLDYTLSLGLNLVADTTACGANQIGCGTTGLIGLTGEVLADGDVDLFATNATLGDLDPTYLYGITDVLSATAASTSNSESFTQLEAAAPGTNIRGVAFAPTAVPEPASLAIIAGALPLFLGMRRKRRA